MQSRQLRLTLLGLASGVLLALLLAPQTRWLVRPQLASGLINDWQNHNDWQSRQQFVHSHPNDYLVQLGGPRDDPMQTPLQHDRNLVPRFPNNPSLRANILRYETSNILTLNRSDSGNYLLTGQPDPPPDLNPDRPLPTPAELAAFDADAAAGERLDPDDAYFPLMRSIGLFVAHRDAEGLAAVTRAGTKTAWREYSEDEVESEWRILDGIYEHREAVNSMAISAALLFPQYGPLRAVARLVTVKAVQEEQAGHWREGLALRRSVAHCGDLMRAESNSYIGTLVGTAIIEVSRIRPGGAAPIKTDPDPAMSPQFKDQWMRIRDQMMQKRLDAYCEYVTRLGHPEAAREAQAQFRAEEQALHLNINSGADSQLQDIVHLAVSLAVGWMTTANLILLLLLNLVAWGLSRLPQISARRPLPPGASIGVWAVLLLGCPGLACLLPTAQPEDAATTGFICLVLGLIPLTAFSLYAVFQPAFRKPFGVTLLAALVTLVVLASLAAWESHMVATLIAAGGQFIPWSSSDDTNNVQLPALTQLLLGIALGMGLPLALTVILSIAARVKRVPISVGLVEGFRVWTPPLVCALAVLYGGLTLWTVRQENAVNYSLERTLHGGGRYFAELTGQPWPGPVR